MRKITERLARLEAGASSGCEQCNNPTGVEEFASRMGQRLEMSLPGYHRRRAAELDAEADRREETEADLTATGRTRAAVPAGQGAARQAGTDPAVGLLCPPCQVVADLAHRVSANMAAAERARTPQDLRRLAGEALAEAARLECQAESSGST